MKRIALALALVLAGSSLVVAPTDANAGSRKFCKQALKTHPMAGEHDDLMKPVQGSIQSSQEGRLPATEATRVALDKRHAASASGSGLRRRSRHAGSLG